MTAITSHRLAVLVIVTTVVACDNVDWAGVDFSLEPPPPARAEDPPQPGAGEETFVSPSPPFLHLVTRNGGEGSVIPVARISGESLLPFPGNREAPELPGMLAREHLFSGSELLLTAGGGRVGTFISSGTEEEVDPTYCRPRPRVAGTMELRPDAMEARRFLAVNRDGTRVPREGSVALVPSTREQRVASLNLAGSLITDLGLRWPPDLVEARGDLQVLQLPERPAALLAATFLYQDRLAVEPPASPEAWSLFFLAEEGETGWEPLYVWHHSAAQGEKAAPRLLGVGDWTGAGNPRLLLEVSGEELRWFVVLAREDGTWSPIYHDPCAAVPPPSGSSAP